MVNARGQCIQCEAGIRENAETVRSEITKARANAEAVRVK